MSNLKTCSRCKSTFDKSYFGISCQKERDKTCNKCRGVAEEQNDTKTISNIKSVKQDLHNLYKKEFNIDPNPKQNKLLTEDEQIERYARNIAFWRRLENEYDDADI